MHVAELVDASCTGPSCVVDTPAQLDDCGPNLDIQHAAFVQKQHLHVQQPPHFCVIRLRKVDLGLVLAVEVEEGLRPQTLFARFLILGCPKAWE